MCLSISHLYVCFILCLAHSSAAPAQEVLPLKSPARGVLKGKITLVGNRPNTAAMDKELHAKVRGHRVAEHFFAGAKEETSQQEWRIDDEGGVGNVFVWLQPPKGIVAPLIGGLFVYKARVFTLDDSDLKPGGTWNSEVVLDAPHCTFVPHVFILFPQYRDAETGKLKPTGQTFTAKNSAKVPQSVDVRGVRNRGMNYLLSPGREIKIVPEDMLLSFRDNIHVWKSAYARAFNHPFAAVSKSDGTYEIKNVPAGVELHVIAWHEKAGFLNSENGQKVTLKEGQNTVDFKLRIPE
jgi:hypothetical protein